MNHAAFQLIVTLLGVASMAMEKAVELRRIARQNKELTPDQERELDQAIASLSDREHWRLQGTRIGP